MSQFFWKVKLHVLLNHLPLSSDFANRSGKDTFAKQLNCLEEWRDEWQFSSRDTTLAQLFTSSPFNAEFEPFGIPGSPQQGSVPLEILNCSDARKVFWWFWRCYPQLLENACCSKSSKFGAKSLDPVWSQLNLKSLLKSASLGYFTRPEDYFIQTDSIHPLCAYLAQFTFTSIQESIQISYTLQDIQLRTWLSHYLAAKICWKVAWKYGPDIFVSPCLYAQPLIDYWLLQQYPEFSQWISVPSERIRSRATFPNTLTMILPDNGSSEAMKGNPVWATMVHAEQVLKQEWLTLGHKAFNALPRQKAEQPAVLPQQWDSWLESQWQSCWAALPIDDRSIGSLVSLQASKFSDPPLRESLVHQVQQQLEAAKYSQVWKLPTAFSFRTPYAEVDAEVGSELYPAAVSVKAMVDAPDERTASRRAESLDAAEVITRGLPKILPHLLGLSEQPAVSFRQLGAHPSALCDRLTEAAEWQVFAASGTEQTSYPENSPETELAAYAAHCRALTGFFHQQLPDLLEQRYKGQLIYANDTGMLLSSPLQDWDQMLWDIYQCFSDDREQPRRSILQRGLSVDAEAPFRRAANHECRQTVNSGFGLVIAHQSLPLPLILRNLWDAVASVNLASSPTSRQDGIQVRVLYPNSQLLIATAQWNTFNRWRSLIRLAGVQPDVFEQIAHYCKQQPVFEVTSIQERIIAACNELLLGNCRASDSGFCSDASTSPAIFFAALAEFLNSITSHSSHQACEATQQRMCDRQVQNWLDLAAFVLQNR